LKFRSSPRKRSWASYSLFKVLSKHSTTLCLVFFDQVLTSFEFLWVSCLMELPSERSLKFENWGHLSSISGMGSNFLTGSFRGGHLLECERGRQKYFILVIHGPPKHGPPKTAQIIDFNIKLNSPILFYFEINWKFDFLLNIDYLCMVAQSHCGTHFGDIKKCTSISDSELSLGNYTPLDAHFSILRPWEIETEELRPHLIILLNFVPCFWIMYFPLHDESAVLALSCGTLEIRIPAMGHCGSESVRTYSTCNFLLDFLFSELSIIGAPLHLTPWLVISYPITTIHAVQMSSAAFWTMSDLYQHSYFSQHILTCSHSVKDSHGPQRALSDAPETTFSFQQYFSLIISSPFESWTTTPTRVNEDISRFYLMQQSLVSTMSTPPSIYSSPSSTMADHIPSFCLVDDRLVVLYKT